MSGDPIVFDFTVSQPDATSMSFVQDGLSLTLSTALYYGGNGGSQLPYEFSTPTLNITSDGVGALNPYNDLEYGFDADGKFEIATFAFSSAVRITSITFMPLPTRYNLSGTNTQFQLFSDGLVLDPASRQYIDFSDFTNEVSLYGDFVGIAAYNRFDQFRIASITVVDLGLDAVADTYSLDSGIDPVVLDVLANDFGAVSITAVDTTGLVGTVTIAEDGLTLIYDEGTAFDNLPTGSTATETFTYTVFGDDGTYETETVTITITGAAGTLNGTSAADNLTGSAGRDFIYGFNGNDTINGAAGNDNIDGGNNNDSLRGGTGNDRIDGNVGNDYIAGEDGNDTLYGGMGFDTMYGGVGADLMYGGASADTMYGGNQNDVMYGDDAADRLDGQAGDDTIYGGTSNDTIYGNIGADRLEGNDGNDSLYGGTENDVLIGGIGNDLLNGEAGVDTASGGTGNDTYYVDDTADAVIELAGEGTADAVISTATYAIGDQIENLTLTGSADINGTGNALANRITGNDGANMLFGLGGADRIEAGQGNDSVSGGTGRDILTGGAGLDAFVFGEFGALNSDTVNDFTDGSDVIQFVGAAFGLAVGSLTADAFALGSAATDALDRIIYDAARGDIWFDADGNGSGARQLVASLTDGLVLDINDFFVI